LFHRHRKAAIDLDRVKVEASRVPFGRQSNAPSLDFGHDRQNLDVAPEAAGKARRIGASSLRQSQWLDLVSDNLFTPLPMSEWS
jgi:hypothetical protein